MASSAQRPVRLSSDTGFLKLIAIVTMTIDHLGAAVYPGQAWMRLIGRIAFPLFAYCTAVGSIYTKNIGKYALRVGILALIAQPIYVLALNHANADMTALSFAADRVLDGVKWYLYSWRSANILVTLLIGILMIWCLRDKRYIILAALTLITALFSVNINYGWKGVALILLFYALADRPAASFTWIAGFMLWWAFASGGSYSLFGLRFSSQLFALLALPFIYIPTQTNVKIGKWFFYLYYPAHLAAIWAIETFLKH